MMPLRLPSTLALGRLSKSPLRALRVHPGSLASGSIHGLYSVSQHCQALPSPTLSGWRSSKRQRALPHLPWGWRHRHRPWVCVRKARVFARSSVLRHYSLLTVFLILTLVWSRRLVPSPAFPPTRLCTWAERAGGQCSQWIFFLNARLCRRLPLLSICRRLPLLSISLLLSIWRTPAVLCSQALLSLPVHPAWRSLLCSFPLPVHPAWRSGIQEGTSVLLLTSFSGTGFNLLPSSSWRRRSLRGFPRRKEKRWNS
mgnify:CR=1 FL=1